MSSRAERTRRRKRRRRLALGLAVAGTAAEAFELRRRGYGLAGEVTVRCREGHTFTTIWIPGVSFTSLRLGIWRYQRCPVGDHWSFVTPVRRDAL